LREQDGIEAIVREDYGGGWDQEEGSELKVSGGAEAGESEVNGS